MSGFNPLTAATILYLTAKGAGAKRDLNLITQACAFLGANLAVVQMAFGFAEDRRDGELRDFILDPEVQPRIVGPEQADAYSLALAALDIDKRTLARRVLRKIHRRVGE